VHQDEACVLGPLNLREHVVVKQPDHFSLAVHLLHVELVLHEVVQQGPLEEREGVDDLEISGATSAGTTLRGRLYIFEDIINVGYDI